MIAADRTLGFPSVAGGTLSESNERGGFSFQLSETPPPTRSQEQAPLDDLVLDLQDFGSWEDPPAESSAQVRPKAPVLANEPSQGIADESLLAEKHVVAVDEHPQVDERPLRDEPLVLSPQPGPVEEPSSPPRIKKIQFPAKRVSKTESSKVAEKPRTRFSDSISAPAVTARLHDETDSEPPPRMEESHSEGDLALPDDLPGLPMNEGQSADDSWGSETPTAKEIWNTARRTWKTTARQAAILGGKGLRASQKAAHNLNTKLKEHREAASKERDARAALVAASHEAAPAAGSRPVDSSDSPASPQQLSSSGSLPPRGVRALKKVAAPLSAIAAAAVVYLGGTQLLGTENAVGLSHSAQAPDIPELGTLHETEPEKEKPAAEDRRAAAANPAEPVEEKEAKAPDDGAMKVEVAPMPDGLSWPGKGLIEVVTSEEELIYVDGVFTGRGPLRRIPVSPGEHEVSIRTGGSKRSGTVQVEINKNTRAVFKSE